MVCLKIVGHINRVCICLFQVKMPDKFYEVYIMSKEIQLSTELINNIFGAIAQHDKGVEEDLMVGLQYLSAVIGYFSAEYPGTDKDRHDLLAQLAAFAVSVGDDRAQSMPAQQQAANDSATVEMSKGKSIATDDPAVGIWKPA